MPAAEDQPRIRENAPPFVGKIYQEYLDEGFVPHSVVVEPRQPQVRVEKPSGIYYDYNTVFFPFASREDVRHDQERRQLLEKLREVHGKRFVKEISLPDGFELIDNYPEYLHRLVIIGPSAARWHTDRALDGSPRSPSEAIRLNSEAIDIADDVAEDVAQAA